MIKKLLEINKKFDKKKINSAIIQSEFYFRCKQENIVCYLEFKDNNSRFDALIFDNNLNKIAIVEFKSYKSKDKKAITNTKQIKKYLSFNLPIFLVVRFEEIEKTIENIKKILVE
jgi:hypothetical protein